MGIQQAYCILYYIFIDVVIRKTERLEIELH